MADGFSRIAVVYSLLYKVHDIICSLWQLTRIIYGALFDIKLIYCILIEEVSDCELTYTIQGVPVVCPLSEQLIISMRSDSVSLLETMYAYPDDIMATFDDEFMFEKTISPPNNANVWYELVFGFALLANVDSLRKLFDAADE